MIATADDWVGLGIAVALAVYLIIVLAKPERF